MGGGWGGAGVASSMGTFLIISVATVKPKTAVAIVRVLSCPRLFDNVRDTLEMLLVS